LHEEAVNDLLELGESWWMGSNGHMIWWMGSNGYIMVDGIQRIYDGGWDHGIQVYEVEAVSQS
jgi:hypothetical protein